MTGRKPLMKARTCCSSSRLAITMLILSLLSCAQPGAEAGWVLLPCNIEQVGEDVYVTFQPLALSQVRLNRCFDQAQVYGVEGRVPVEVDGKLLNFSERVEVAEIVLFECTADRLKIAIQRAEARRRPFVPREAQLEELGEFKPTFYWIVQEAEFEGEACDTPLIGPDAEELGRFPAEFVRRAKIEGTAKLRDGRVINVAGKGKGFAVVAAPNGCGAGGYHLIPFRSIAVDRSVVPLGTKLYIPEAVGMELPDGTTHDGLFYAHDVGGAIKEKRIDFFAASKAWQSIFERAGIHNMKPLHIYQVN